MDKVQSSHIVFPQGSQLITSQLNRLFGLHVNGGANAAGSSKMMSGPNNSFKQSDYDRNDQKSNISQISPRDQHPNYLLESSALYKQSSSESKK